MTRATRISSLLLVLAVSLGRIDGSAQEPATSRSVYLDVKYDTAYSTTRITESGIEGTYGKTQTKKQALKIRIRNMAHVPGEFTVEWYFFGKPVDGKSCFIYDLGSAEVKLGPGKYAETVLLSEPLHSSRYRKSYGHYYYKSGDKPDGWAVRALVDGESVRAKASSPKYARILKDPEMLKSYLEREE